MIARLAQLLVLVSIGWLIARLIRRTGTREAPRQGSVASRGRMVRDRVCNTFVPDGRALIERVDGEAPSASITTTRSTAPPKRS